MADEKEVKQRFAIYVPDPSVRINMGQPDKDTPYGYVGMSLQSDWDLYIDVNKNTFTQATHVLHQAGGDWFQYADGPMVMSTQASQKVASGEQITIVAGAPYGNDTGFDHGTRVRAHKYNELDLHYRVEEVQNGLYEFLYGRCKREEKDSAAKAITQVLKGSARYFRGPFHRIKTGAALEQEAALKGFRAMAKESATLLGLAEADPTWLEEVTHSELATKGAEYLKYGASDHFKPYDPYDLTDPGKVQPPGRFTSFLVGAKNLLTAGRRLVDVTRKIGACLTDNLIVSNILRLADAMDSLAQGIAIAERLFTRHLHFWNRYIDEFNSGLAARPVAAVEALVSPYVGSDEQATITSAVGPFRLAPGARMSVYANTSPGSRYDSAPIVAPRATLDADAAPQTGWLGTVQVVYDGGRITRSVTLDEDDTASAATLAGKLDEAGPEPVTVVAGKLHFESLLHGRSSEVVVRGLQTVLTNLGLGGQLTKAARGAELVAVAAPTFPIDGTLSVALTGGATDLSFDVVFDQVGTLAAALDAIRVVFQAQHADYPASAKRLSVDAEGKLKLQADVTPTVGETWTTIEVTASSRDLFERLGFALAGENASASSASVAGNVEDASSVTAAEVAKLLVDGGLAEGIAAVAVVEGAVEIESAHTGNGSYVRGTRFEYDTMASTVGLHEVSDHIEEDSMTFGSWAEDVYNGYQVINHEIMKMPEDLRHMLRPLAEAAEDVQELTSKLEGVLEPLVDGIPAAFNPDGPPAAIGLFADDGITLGTRERIVGAAGGGFVFFADGGTGQRDTKKFVPLLEKGINAVLEWKPPFLGGKDVSEDPENVGFRVCSDTEVGLMATTTAELLALGRATKDSEVVGVGVARMAASHAAEVAAHTKVSIGARAKPETPDQEDRAGTVELAGDHIQLGATDVIEIAALGIRDSEGALLLPGKDALSQPRERTVGGRGWSETFPHPATRTVGLQATNKIALGVGDTEVTLEADKCTFGWLGFDAHVEKQTAAKAEVDRLTTKQTELADKLVEAKKKVIEGQTLQGNGAEEIRRTRKREVERLEKETEETADALGVKSPELTALTSVSMVAPLLRFSQEEIILGFQNTKDGTVSDGPHLKITPEGFWLETGAEGSEVSINTSDGKKLQVAGDTAWTTVKNVALTPTGNLGLDATGEISLTGANVKIDGNGTVKIG